MVLSGSCTWFFSDLPESFGLVHDPDYRTSWKDWESFVEILTEKISEIDETIPELPPKDLVRYCSCTWPPQETDIVLPGLPNISRRQVLV